ncbi:MAG: acyl carrier protein [bacterium]|nr:acyl carrier protein [bacterium]
MNRPDVSATIFKYVTEQYLQDCTDAVTCDTPLISGGYVDSFSMVALKMFLDKTYAITIPNEIATAEAFDSVNRITDLVMATLHEQAP